MSSDKRQFVDFTQFGGKIENGVYTYPTLYMYDANKNKRFWNVFVKLTKSNAVAKKYETGWNPEKDLKIPILEKYLKDDDIPKSVSQIWTESGVVDGKMIRSLPSFPKAVNIGKTNERNCLQQGLVKARALYQKQREKGGRTHQEINTGIASQNRYYPMLAREFTKEKNKVVYPVLVQPKLDGMRCIAYLDKNNKTPQQITYENVVLYSRNLKDITGFDHLRKELLTPLMLAYNTKKNESIYLDGEFYKHGNRLQDIVAEVRNIQKNTENINSGVKLYLFDCFYPHETNSLTPKSYKDRLVDLLTIFPSTASQKYKYIEIVEDKEANNEEEVNDIYNDWISRGYEGVMIKDKDAAYSTSDSRSGSNLRSRGVLKLKGHFDDEYKVIDFTDGSKGKDKNAIIWILETKDKKQFHATPKNMTYEERYALYKKLTDNPKEFDVYKGKMMTIEYQDKSKNGVPLRAKSILPIRAEYE